MGKTSFTGPILGNADSGGGVFRDAPIELVNKFSNQAYFNDFISQSDFQDDVTAGSHPDWTDTVIGTVTATPDIVTVNGMSLLDIEGDVAAEGHVLQHVNEAWQASAGRVITFEAVVGQTDGNDCDWFIGIGETLTTFMGTNGTLSGSAVNYAGFHLLGSDADGIVDCVAKGASGAELAAGVANTVALADSTITTGVPVNFHRYGVRITGVSTVEFFFDGRKVQGGSVAVDFDDASAITLCAVSGAANGSTYVDYVATSQTRLPVA
jgi:hypothetical protein